MKTILKWPGGKEKELPIIRANIPSYRGRYVEPFVGGGAVFFDTDHTNCVINDKSEELIALYRCVRSRDGEFVRFLQCLCDEFAAIGEFVDAHPAALLALYCSEISVEAFLGDFSHFFSAIARERNEIFQKELRKNLSRKIARSQKLEAAKGSIPDGDRIDNLEAALKSAYYMYVRDLLNHPAELPAGARSAVFFFVREYCYSSMFRYNAKGEFNVPYGGITYSRKDFRKKADYILSEEMHEKLSGAEIFNEDFETFLDGLQLGPEDFVFLDPPYDSDFSTYTRNTFGPEEQKRLCSCLKRTKAKIMLVIKNTDFIYELYREDFRISSFDKTYLVSFKNRNDRNVEHLVITNY